MKIEFDKQNVELVLRINPDEKYKPTKEISDLAKKVSKLKQKVDEFNESEIRPRVEEIDELIKDINSENLKVT